MHQENEELRKNFTIVKGIDSSFEKDMNAYSTHDKDIKNLKMGKKAIYVFSGLSLGFNFVLILIVVYVMRKQAR